MNNAVFSYRPCCKNRRFGGKNRLHLQGKKNPRAKESASRLLTDQSTVLSSRQATRSSETSFLTRPTRSQIPEDGVPPLAFQPITYTEFLNHLFALHDPEEYKSRSSSLCNFLHSPITSSLFGPYLPQHLVLKHPQSMFPP
jgi:hypothetical protein